MTNGINQDLTKLAMYAQGYELHPSDRTFKNASIASSLIAAKEASTFLDKSGATVSPLKKSTYTKANWGKIGQGYKDAKKAALPKQHQIRDAFAGKKGIKGYYQGAGEALRRENLSILEEKVSQKFKLNEYKTSEGSRHLKQLMKDEYLSDTRKLIEESKGLSGQALKEQSLKINQEYAKGKLRIIDAQTKGPLKPSSRLGKTGDWAKRKIGYRAAQRKIYTKAAEGSKFWGKAVAGKAKLPGGTGIMAAVEAIGEAPTVIDTYKQLGGWKGTKQLAKSSVKVGASVAGYAVGAKVGAAIGTAICPGIGTAIGVAVGFLGSWLFSKTANAIVGKDELQIAKEKEAKELAQAAEKDPDIKRGLLLAAKERMEAEGIDIANPTGDAKEVIKANKKDLKAVLNADNVNETEDKTNSSVKIGDYKQTFANLKALHDFASQDHFLIKLSA